MCRLWNPRRLGRGRLLLTLCKHRRDSGTRVHLAVGVCRTAAPLHETVLAPDLELKVFRKLCQHGLVDCARMDPVRGWQLLSGHLHVLIGARTRLGKGVYAPGHVSSLITTVRYCQEHVELLRAPRGLVSRLCELGNRQSDTSDVGIGDAQRSQKGERVLEYRIDRLYPTRNSRPCDAIADPHPQKLSRLLGALTSLLDLERDAPPAHPQTSQSITNLLRDGQ
mmetsp:Transcript_1575/g.5203  ORF Transcript_1575/g.5203 Transcript_1575/m.5203 type:complete len:223 (+) Transcript_1575:719-1387(+)